MQIPMFSEPGICSLAGMRRVATPQTRPSRSTSGPPELPPMTLAFVWIVSSFLRTTPSEGLLSIQVAFQTVGRPFHFVTTTQEAAALSFSSYPRETAQVFRQGAQGLVLLLLLAAALRLGLHLPAGSAKRVATQTLLLLLCGLLAALTFTHLAAAGLTALASLFAIRHGRLWPATASEGSA